LAEGKNDSGAADLDCSPWDDEFLGHLEQTERDIGITTGPKLFRPPGGVAWPGQLRLARNRGYECVLGCAYPHDPMHPAWIRIGFGKKFLQHRDMTVLLRLSDSRRAVVRTRCRFQSQGVGSGVFSQRV
jgi:hypothetical protein